MKISIMLGLFLLTFVSSTLAIDKEHLDGRIQRWITKLDIMQEKPDKSIPPESIRKAKGVILLERTKAGVVFAFSGGNGIALVRNSKTQKWGPGAFVTSSEASLGAQIGGESSFYVILLMTTNSIRMVRDSNFEFGGEVSGTAGDASGGAKGTSSSTDPVVLIYNDKKGFFGGAAIKGDSINPDTKANEVYYGEAYTMKEIISGEKTKPTDTVNALIKKLNDYSKPQKK